MATLQDALTSATATARNICPDEKKLVHVTEQDAIAFAEKNRGNFGKQYPYPCEYDNHWHLTTQVPGAPKLAKVTLPNVLDMIPRQRFRGLAPAQEVLKRYNVGKSTVKELAAEFGVSEATIKARLNEAREQEGKRPHTLDSIAEEEKRLQAQLNKLLAQKESLLEAKRLKLNPCPVEGMAGVLVSQDGQSMSFRLEDFAELLTKGAEYLASRQERVQ